MNIGIDIRSLMSPRRAGVGAYTFELLSAIFKIDQKNRYFLFYNSHSDVSQHIPHWPRERTYHVAAKWPNKLLNASIKIFGLPKLNKLISRYGKLDCFFSPNLNFTAISKNIRHILTIHDLSFKFYSQFFAAKQKLWHLAVNPKKQCRRANMILTPSQNTKQDLIDYYKIPPEKIKVIYPGIGCHSEQSEESLSNLSPYRDPSSAKSSLGMTETDIRKKYNLPNKFILFLGTIEPRKNIIGLIEAFELFSAQRPASDISLVIAGGAGWNNEKIYARALASPLRNKIEFTGYVDAADKPLLYAMSELFVYPSFYEGFGFPVLEAMACGAPVITSNRSSLPEIAENAAWLVNPNRPAEIADAMIKLTSDENLKKHFINKGFEQAKKFNWEQTARQWLDLLAAL